MSRTIIDDPWSDDARLREYAARARASARKTNPTLLAQLRHRVAQGEDADAVLDELQVGKGRFRRMYHEALSAPPDE